MVFGLCPAGTEFYYFTKTSFELHRKCALKKYGSQCLAQFLRLFLILTTVIWARYAFLNKWGKAETYVEPWIFYAASCELFFSRLLSLIHSWIAELWCDRAQLALSAAQFCANFKRSAFWPITYFTTILTKICIKIKLSAFRKDG